MTSPFEILHYGCVQVQVQVAELTEPSMRAHLEGQTAMIEEGLASGPPCDKAIIVIDASVDLVPPAKIRRMQADWTNAHQEQLEKVVHGIGFVVPSAISRGAMTAVLWLTRPASWPMIAHASLDRALDWALREAETMGGDVDPRLRADGERAVRRDRERLLAG